MDVLTAIGDADPDFLRGPKLLEPLLRTMQSVPELYALNIGFNDGAFSQVLRLPRGLMEFGPNHTPLPQGTAFVLQLLQHPADRPTNNDYTYVTETGEVLLRE